ncbi:putative endolysin [Pectobacterium phage DU_PP_V]|uniref:Putative endolysin n=1 Tax=Pectobacterium phage DU_PP_V TaxID=2041492 RepID=A0A2D2W6T8_9CAUD|nr:endolysin [Pectobacterium phage DU_PP_V]ATS94012.1 putative endolysin [Pectobacterium phage DU_PP_V]
MSFRFGSRSLAQLDTVKPQLKELAIQVLSVSPIDFTVIQGKRTLSQSQQNVANGTSFLKDPSKSKHITGDAIDFAPFINGKINWDDLEAFWTIAKIFKQEAEKMGIPIKLGADWNGSGDYKDEIKRGTFDGGHIELV